MKMTQRLHEMGQSLWLDNITRGLVTSGVLQDEGARSFVKSWKDLLECIASKCESLAGAG